MDRISWKSTFGLALAAVVCLLAAPASAGIVYTMTNASGLQNGWALSGTITVSGTGTDLGSSDITSWAYTVTDGSASHTYSSTNQSGEAVIEWNTGMSGGFFSMPSRYDANDFPSTFWSNQGLAFPLTATQGWVIGTVVSAVPEIDPAGIGSVLTLVTGALGLLERRRLKTA